MTLPPPTVYLDHAATTPMLPAAVEAMTGQLLDVGNASSLHASGRRSRRVVEESRETIAQALGCPSLVLRLEVGEQQADRHRSDLGFAEALGQLVELGVLQRLDDAVRADPLGKLELVLGRDQRCRFRRA